MEWDRETWRDITEMSGAQHGREWATLPIWYTVGSAIAHSQYNDCLLHCSISVCDKKIVSEKNLHLAQGFVVVVAKAPSVSCGNQNFLWSLKFLDDHLFSLLIHHFITKII